MNSQRQRYRIRTWCGDEEAQRLLAKSSSSTDDNTKKMGKKQGVYSRPSAAIERGSGFFIPGLEGPKVRLVFGTLLLGLTAYNHAASIGQGKGDAFSEALTVVFSLLVLLQGAVEYRKDTLKRGVIIGQEGSGGQSSSGKVKSYQQLWSVPVDDDTWRERVTFAASTYLSLTPASHMMLIGPGKIIYSLGISEQRKEYNTEACQAAIDTLAKSKSGRVALPPQHPAVEQLADEDYNRCVVLQRIDDNLCWLMTSDQLLPGFSQQDLQWLGQMAKYVDPNET